MLCFCLSAEVIGRGTKHISGLQCWVGIASFFFEAPKRLGRNPPRISPGAEVFGMASGHINPSLPLARQLVSQGHKVIGSGARPHGKSMFRMYQYSIVTIVSVSCSI